MLGVIAIAFVAIVAALLVLAATRPGTLRVQRATTIAAPPEKIFPLINELQRHAGWNPWEKLDPEMARTFSGPASGPGAVFAWRGNRKVGAGRLEIVDASPFRKVALKLDYIEPFASRSEIDFTLESHGEGTVVTWTSTGPFLFLAKVVDIFCDMERMVGGMFEQGLTDLKRLAEA